MNERAKNIDVAQVYKLWEAYATSTNEGNLERWTSLWTEEGIQMPPGEPRRIGKEHIQRAMQTKFERFSIHNMVIDTDEVRILGDRAYSHGTYRFDITPKEGGMTESIQGKFLDILVKQADGSWKIAIDCHNYNEAEGSP